jgi:type IV secretory pathway TrbD component
MKRVWSATTKVLGGLFLFSGGSVSVALVTGILVGQASGGILTLLMILLVMFGIAPASLGSWLLHVSAKVDRQVLRDRFFELLQAQRGRISLLEFATATQLEPANARCYLDRWAKEFSADFEVSEAGEIYYVFVEPGQVLPSGGSGEGLRQVMQRQQLLA